MADELCPTCHSKIGTQSTIDSGRIRGKEGTDSLGNPIPRWTSDPIFTLGGFSDATYSLRRDRVRKPHIKELQDTRKAQEGDADLSESLKTQFSDIDVDAHVSRRHIIELRESTEKLLNDAGLTLEEYFKLDDEGGIVVQNPKIELSGGNNPQDEWVNASRGAQYVDKDGNAKSTFTLPDGSTQQSPTLPNSTHIRAIHMEDLRHPISVGILTLLLGESDGTTTGDSPVFSGTKIGATNFKNIGTCE